MLLLIIVSNSQSFILLHVTSNLLPVHQDLALAQQLKKEQHKPIYMSKMPRCNYLGLNWLW